MKASATWNNSFSQMLQEWLTITGKEAMALYVVYAGNYSFKSDSVNVIAWNQMDNMQL